MRIFLMDNMNLNFALSHAGHDYLLFNRSSPSAKDIRTLFIAICLTKYTAKVSEFQNYK